MSMGYGGSARLVLQDENTAIYEYSPYNLNEVEYRNSERIYDGLITISKDGLVEPDIHEKCAIIADRTKKPAEKVSGWMLLGFFRDCFKRNRNGKRKEED